MSTMHLFALRIDDARDVFSADPALAARLRTVSTSELAKDPRPNTSWALFRKARSHQPVPDPAAPTSEDMESLLTGRYLSPSRLDAAWTLIRTWFEDLSLTHVRVPFTQRSFERAEFALACAGLPSELALGTLLGLDPQFPVMRPSHISVGYAKHDHVRAMNQALASMSIRDEPTQWVVSFLARIPANEDGRTSAPDVITIWERASARPAG